jgi:hypothetical protein
MGLTDKTEARARALGIIAPLGDRFPCIIEGHEHQARLVLASAGVWKYRCAGDTRTPAALPGLPHAYALAAYAAAGNHQPNVSDTELARWSDRLEHEAGLSDRSPLDVPVPDDAPMSARLLAPVIGQLVGLRDPERWSYGRDMFTFSRGMQEEGQPFVPGFGPAYSGLSQETVRRGLRALEAIGHIERAGKIGPATLWRLRLPTQRVAPGAAAAVEGHRPDLDRGERVAERDRDLAGGQEVLSAGQPALECVHEPKVLHAELLLMLEPSLRGLDAAERGAPPPLVGSHLEAPPETFNESRLHESEITPPTSRQKGSP